MTVSFWEKVSKVELCVVALTLGVGGSSGGKVTVAFTHALVSG